MQSRTEMSHNKLMRRKNHPRGYFKKLKHDTENVRPPDIAKMPRKNSYSMNYGSFVNIRTLWTIFVVLNLFVAPTFATTTILPDLNSLSLQKPQTNDVATYDEENGSKSE